MGLSCTLNILFAREGKLFISFPVSVGLWVRTSSFKYVLKASMLPIMSVVYRNVPQLIGLMKKQCKSHQILTFGVWCILSEAFHPLCTSGPCCRHRSSKPCWCQTLRGPEQSRQTTESPGSSESIHNGLKEQEKLNKRQELKCCFLVKEVKENIFLRTKLLKIKPGLKALLQGIKTDQDMTHNTNTAGQIRHMFCTWSGVNNLAKLKTVPRPRPLPRPRPFPRPRIPPRMLPLSLRTLEVSSPKSRCSLLQPVKENMKA